ncbi:MAG: hypothetical protein ABSE70_11470, partial [Candidatus Limnocylindrales bacterium]
MDVLLECKRSELPYVFFQSSGTVVDAAPVVVGAPSNDIEISTDDDTSTYSLTLLQALDLARHPFLAEPPACASVFSKVVRKGKDLELSGSDSYNGLVQPLVSALEHARRVARPRPQWAYHDVHLVVAVAVVDAPLLVAKIVGATSDEILTFSPWVRVLRDETEALGWHGDKRTFEMDVVHADAFADYVERGLLPFAHEFGDRVLRHQGEVA